jgi:hypothetical protein
MADYCTLEEVRAELVKQGTAQVDDNAIGERIPRVTGLINGHLGHSFDDETIANEMRRGEQVILGADGVLQISVSKGHCRSVTSASVSNDARNWHVLDLSALLIDGYVLHFVDVSSPISRGRLFARLGYVGGCVANDPRMSVLNYAACRWTAFLYHKREAPFEVIAYPDLGQVNVPSGVPSDIRQALDPLVRVRP